MATIDVNDVVQLTHTAAQVDADIDGSVRADIGQSFSEAQKAQARENIDAAGTFYNILINGFFTVNQRKQSVYTSNTHVYTFDRWLMVENSNAGGVTIEKTADGVRFSKLTASGSPGGRIAQRIDDEVWNVLRGKQVTFAIAYKSDVAFLLGYGATYGGVYTASITCPAAEDWTIVSATRTVGESSADYWFSLAIANAQPAGSVDIKCIVLTEGSTSPIRSLKAPGYYSELVKCLPYYQRFYGNSSVIATGFCFSTARAQMQMPLFAPMRANGTVTLHGTAYLVGGAFVGANGKTFTDANIMYRNAILGTNSALIQIDSLSGLTVGQAVQIQLRDATSYIDVSADYY